MEGEKRLYLNAGRLSLTIWLLSQLLEALSIVELSGRSIVYMLYRTVGSPRGDDQRNPRAVVASRQPRTAARQKEFACLYWSGRYSGDGSGPGLAPIWLTKKTVSKLSDD